MQPAFSCFLSGQYCVYKYRLTYQEEIGVRIQVINTAALGVGKCALSGQVANQSCFSCQNDGYVS
jgi:hypothetical protein